MPAVDGFGYIGQYATFEEGFGPSICRAWIPKTAGNSSPVSGNLDADIYFYIDSASATNFERGSYFISANDTNIHYKYKITQTTTAYTVQLYDSDGETVVDSVTLDISGNDGAVQFTDIALAILCDYTDEEHPPIIKAGIGSTYFGLNLADGMPISGSPCCFQWFTASRALEIITDIMVVTKVTTSGGTVVTRLKESDDFIITQLPDDVFGKNDLTTNGFSGLKYADVIQIGESDEYAQNLWAWHYFTTYLAYWGDSLYSSPYAVHSAFLAKYKEGVGSDLMRKTADGKYTNAGDSASFNALTIITGEEGSLFRINFAGGYAQWRSEYTYGASNKYLDFFKEDGTLLDTWHVNGGTRSPSPYMPTAYAYYADVSTAFLCKQGNNFYIVGNVIGLSLTDADGNPVPTSYYSESGAYVVLKKLNSSANTVLNDATETIVEFDKSEVEETSEVGSTPQDTDELYDHSSIWDSGENAGTNEGIRHNGSDIIDASNGELTEDHPVGQIPEYNESGENRIPTPLNTKMIVGFAPTPEEMETFSDLMKQTDFIDKMVGYFTNAVDGVISCHTCIAPALDKGPDCYLKYGLWDTSLSGLTMKTLTQKMYHCYMGSINLLEKRNSYKDYPPFTNYKIYLPYIGVRDIDGRVLVGKQLSLYYHINVLTGDIIAELRVENQNSQVTSSFYYWTGNTLEPFPLTSRDFSSQIQSGINAILSTGTAIASGASGNVIGAFAGGISAVKNLSDAFRPDIRTVGTVAGNMAQQMYGTAYIIKEYPYLSETNPYNYARLSGLPSNIGNQISKNSTGTNSDPHYISFRAIDLYNLKTNKKQYHATDAEKEEIDSLLKTGVYV